MTGSCGHRDDEPAAPGWYRDPTARGGHSRWDGHRWSSGPEELHDLGSEPRLHLLEPVGFVSTHLVTDRDGHEDVLGHRAHLERLPWRLRAFFPPEALELALRFGAPCARGLVIDDFLEQLSHGPRRATGRTQSSAEVLEESQRALMEEVAPGWTTRREVLRTWTPRTSHLQVPLRPEDLLLVAPLAALAEHWESLPRPSRPTDAPG